MSISLRELVAKLGLQVDPKGFKQADQQLANVMKGLGGVAALATAAGVAFIAAEKAVGMASAAFQEMGDQAMALSRIAPTLKMSSGELQGWQHTVKLAGVSGDAFVETLRGLQLKLYAVTKGSSEAVMAFGRLGVSTSKIKSGNLSGFLEDVAEKYKGADIGDYKVIGKFADAGLSALLPVLVKGKKALQDYRAEVKLFGGQFEDEDLESVKAYREEQARLGLVMDGVRNNILGPFYNMFAKIGKSLADFIKEQKGTQLDSLRKSFDVFRLLEPQITRLLKWAYKLLPVIGQIGRFFNGVIVVVSSVVEAIINLGLAIDKSGALLIAVAVAVGIAWFPTIAIFAAIFLVLEDIIVFLKGGKSLTGELLVKFVEWLKEVEKGGGIMGGIAGILLQAFRYLWSGQLKKDWEFLIIQVKDAWQSFFDWLDKKLAVSEFKEFITFLKAFSKGEAFNPALEEIRNMPNQKGGKRVYKNGQEVFESDEEPVSRRPSRPVGTTPIGGPVNNSTRGPTTVNVSIDPSTKNAPQVAQEVSRVFLESSEDDFRNANP